MMLRFLRRHIRSIATTALACGTLAYCLLHIDWHTFFEALGSINHLLFLSFMGVFVLVVLSCDALAMTDIFRQTIGKTRYWDVFTLRGASYLPTILNYHLGQAMFTWFLSRLHKAPVWRVAGATLLSYGGMLGALLVAACSSYALKPQSFPWMMPLLLGAALLSLIYIVVLRIGGDFAARFESSRVLSEAGFLGHVRAVLVRLPHIFVQVVGVWVPFFFFGVPVPLSDALALMPILLLVGALPLTPQGLGTRELVALQLLAPYAPGTPEEGAARITACCLTWAAAFTIAEVAISLSVGPAAHRLVRAEAVSPRDGT